MAVVGSPRDDFYDSRVGSAYAFAKPEGGWSNNILGVKIIAPGANSVSSEFGAAAALGGDIIAVGAPGEDWHTGRAYAFDVGTVKRIAAPPTLTVTGPVAIVNEGDEAEFPVRMSPRKRRNRLGRVSRRIRIHGQRHSGRGLRKRQRRAGVRAGRNAKDR